MIRGCRLERRLASYAAQGRVLSDRARAQIARECAWRGCETCARRARIQEIHAENARVEQSRARCPTCGCSSARRCLLVLPDDRGMARCAAAGELADVCSACLTPEHRGDPRLWNMPDDETIAEMVRLGLAVPVVAMTRKETP